MRMLLSAQQLCKSFGETPLFLDVTFQIYEKEKIAIVGANGVGKSTLLRVLTEQLSPDSGQIIKPKDVTIGFLEQQPHFSSTHTVYDELLQAKQQLLALESKMKQLAVKMKEETGETLSRSIQTYTTLQQQFALENGYAYQSEIIATLNGLGFSEADFKRPVTTLSGGEKTKLQLGKLLLSKPDLLFLDEPTNHLDLSSLSWLESTLKNCDSSILLISHDRYFLDQTVCKIFDFEQHKIQIYQGNYSEFQQKKEAQFAILQKQYEKQQKERKRQEEVITKLKSFNREKSIRRAESRQKLLDRTDWIERPKEQKNVPAFSFSIAKQSGKEVLTATQLAKSFSQKILFSDVSFSIHRGEKVALIGKNGTGKTTLLRICLGEVLPDQGKLQQGIHVTTGYYDQHHQQLHENYTVLEELCADIPLQEQSTTALRSTLAAFGFQQDHVFSKVSTLSGGEKGRLALAKLMCSKANFLLLDEPTNHLDLASKKILEQAIAAYPGTVLYISHDRYFINKTCTKLLELDQQTLTCYQGNYDAYMQEKNVVSRQMQTLITNAQTPLPSSDKKDLWKQQKKEEAQMRKVKKTIASLEQKIEALEEEIASIDLQLADEAIATDAAALLSYHTQKESLQEELTHLYEEWEHYYETISETNTLS